MTELERVLLNDFQHDFPLTPRPFGTIAARCGRREGEVLAVYRRLLDEGKIGRIGAVVAHDAVGCSTLAAMRVPADRLEAVAALVNGYPEVNHNYARTHDLNLWFVVTAPTPGRVAAVLDDIGARTGMKVIDLPMEEAFHLDLGFTLQWS